MAEVRKENEIENNAEAAVGGGNTLVAPFAELTSGSWAEILSELRREDEPIFNMMPPVKTFITRCTNDLVNLHEVLQKPRKPTLVSQCVAISGLGGVGKSELARKYAWEYYRFYKHIIWMNCGTMLDTLKSFKKLAEALKIIKPTPDDYEYESDHKGLEKDLQSILPNIYKRLSKFKTLLIFDNVDQFEDIKDFIPLNLTPADEKPAIIITSRNSDWDVGEEGDVEVILLKEFTRDEATSYVKKSLEINDEDKSYDLLISELIETLCYFPLALHQAASCIKTKSSLSEGIQEYLNEFRDEGKKGNLLKWRPKRDRYTETTYTTWQTTFENIRNKETHGKLAIQLVEIMSYLTPDHISFEKIFTKLVEDKEKLKEAIDILVKYSIITVEAKVANIHRLVQLVVRLWLKANQREEEVLRNAITQVYKYLHEPHLVSLWSYVCNYTTLIDDFLCKTCDESDDHRKFILAMGYLVEDGNVLAIRKIIGHLESNSDLLHKLRLLGFDKTVVDCDHNATTKCTCLETHVKNIYLFHAEVNKASKTSKTEELEVFLQSIDEIVINSWWKGCTTALHKSIESGNLDVVKILLKYGAGINIPNIDSDCPLKEALVCNHPEIAEYLLDHGANPNPYVNFDCTYICKPIHYAATLGYVNIMQRLAVTKVDFEYRSSDNWTPLHFAARNDQLEIVKFLISKGVDVTAKTHFGQTACEIAVENGSIRVVKYLIKNKLVDVNWRGRCNETLLHIAVSHGRLDIVEYLLDDETHEKADINAFDNLGLTPLLKAVENLNIEIVRYLIEHGASVHNVQKGNNSN